MNLEIRAEKSNISIKIVIKPDLQCEFNELDFKHIQESDAKNYKACWPRNQAVNEPKDFWLLLLWSLEDCRCHPSVQVEIGFKTTNFVNNNTKIRTTC
jgi:hypothetical protein